MNQKNIIIIFWIILRGALNRWICAPLCITESKLNRLTKLIYLALSVIALLTTITYLISCGGSSSSSNSAGTCGISSAEAKIEAVEPITLTNNQVPDNVTVYVTGVAARTYVPQPGFNTTSGIVVDASDNIYISALGTFLLSEDVSYEQITSSGAFYLTLGPDDYLYTDSPNDGNSIIKISKESGATSTLATDLAVSVGAMINLTATPDGYIYADAFLDEDSTNYSLIRVSLSDGSVETVSDTISGPKAVDGDGNLYILNGTSIYKISAGSDSTAPEEILCLEYPEDSLETAYGMVIADNGNFLITEKAASFGGDPEIFTNQLGTRIFEIDHNTGNLSTYLDGLYGTAGIAKDSSGNIYITEIFSGAVKKISSNLTVTTLISGNLIANAMDIIFNDSDELLITSAETSLIVKATADETAHTVRMRGNIIGFNLYAGVDAQYAYTSLAKDSAGNIYVAEYAPDITRTGVSKISTDGKITTFIESADSPNGLAFDDEDNLWVSNAVSGEIEQYNSSGTLLGNTLSLSDPSDLVWYDGAIYVAEYGAKRITRVLADYSHATFLNLDESPVDLAFSSEGDLVFTTQSVLYLLRDGETEPAALMTYNDLATLQGVVFDDEDSLYVCVSTGLVVKLTGL